MIRALFGSSSSNDKHPPTASPTTTTIASENISASYHDSAANKHANAVKSELSYANDHIQSAARHATASISHSIEKGKAGINAELMERQKRIEKEKKEALEDTYRTPQYNALNNHYNQIFQMKPFVNHYLTVQTPDIINTKGVNYLGWQWIPTLRFGVGTIQSNNNSNNENVMIDSTLTANRGGKASYTDFSIGTPISDPSNAWMYSSTSIKNNDNGMGFDYYSNINENYGFLGVGFRPGPRSPSLALHWKMGNTLTGEKNHQLSLASSHCLYRNPPLNESLTGGFGVTTKPMTTCKTMDHRSLESIGAAFNYSIQNDQLSASINLDPYTAKVQGGQMQVSSTQRLSSTSEFPQYSIGMIAGMIALDPLTNRSNEKFTRADFDTDAIFSSSLVSKPLVVGDFLYRPSASLRYRARITSDLGVCLMYQHTLQKNFQIHAAISNGVKGLNGSAAHQGNIVGPVFAPTVAIGLTLDGNE